MNKRYILASASPRRKMLISQYIKNLRVIPSGASEIFDESKPIADEIPRIARLKADLVYEKHTDYIVIAADTVVVKDDVVYGKPKNIADALRMLWLLNNSVHSVFTAVAVRSQGVNFEFMEETKVTFNNCAESLLEWYIATGEPMDCAGAYAIQGYGGLLVKKIDGDYNNVVGLPLSGLIHRLIKSELFSI